MTSTQLETWGPGLTLSFLLSVLPWYLKTLRNFILAKLHSTDIPVKILKDNADIFAVYICGFFNESLNCCKFPSILKCANVAPVFKKGYRGSEENCRPVSILPVMSKIFEMLLYKQLTVFADQNLSKYQYGFRKRFSAQYSLVAMVER